MVTVLGTSFIYATNIRVLAYLRRFVLYSQSKDVKHSEPVSVQEFLDAENFAIRNLQLEEFPKQA